MPDYTKIITDLRTEKDKYKKQIAIFNNNNSILDLLEADDEAFEVEIRLYEDDLDNEQIPSLHPKPIIEKANLVKYTQAQDRVKNTITNILALRTKIINIIEDKAIEIAAKEGPNAEVDPLNKLLEEVNEILDISVQCSVRIELLMQVNKKSKVLENYDLTKPSKELEIYLLLLERKNNSIKETLTKYKQIKILIEKDPNLISKFRYQLLAMAWELNVLIHDEIFSDYFVAEFKAEVETKDKNEDKLEDERLILEFEKKREISKFISELLDLQKLENLTEASKNKIEEIREDAESKFECVESVLGDLELEKKQEEYQQDFPNKVAEFSAMDQKEKEKKKANQNKPKKSKKKKKSGNKSKPKSKSSAVENDENNNNNNNNNNNTQPQTALFIHQYAWVAANLSKTIDILLANLDKAKKSEKVLEQINALLELIEYHKNAFEQNRDSANLYTAQNYLQEITEIVKNNSVSPELRKKISDQTAYINRKIKEDTDKKMTAFNQATAERNAVIAKLGDKWGPTKEKSEIAKNYAKKAEKVTDAVNKTQDGMKTRESLSISFILQLRKEEIQYQQQAQQNQQQVQSQPKIEENKNTEVTVQTTTTLFAPNRGRSKSFDGFENQKMNYKRSPSLTR